MVIDGLGLSSPEWARLADAYGSASDIPALLGALDGAPPHDDSSAEPYNSLWSALCHQGDIYSASFAAVPHLSVICRSQPGKAHWTVLLLVVCIEIARLNGRGPEIPSELSDAYAAAITALPSTVATMLSSQDCEELTSIASAAVAVSQGRAQLAEAIIELEGDVLDEFLEWIAQR